MRPTIRTLSLLGVVILLSLGILLIKGGWPPLMSLLPGVVLALCFWDALKSWPSSGFSVHFRLPKSLYVGADDFMELDIVTPQDWQVSKAWIMVDTGEVMKPCGMQYCDLAPGVRNLVRIKLTAGKRGGASFDKIWIRWQGPMKLAGWVRVIAIDKTVPVLPNIKAVAEDALKFSARDALFGIKPQWQQGSGTEFDALREYVPGFDSRSIDWKSSARHRKLICKEFHTERNHQIMVAYDTGHLMREPVDGISKLDHAINAGLLLSYMSLRSGDRVGLMGFDAKVHHYVGPAGGTQNFNQLQQRCAHLEYAAAEANYTLAMAELMSRLNRRSLIVLLTDFVDTVTAELMVENIKRLARRHLVIFVSLRDRELYQLADQPSDTFSHVSTKVIAQDFIQERDVVLEKLTRMGVQCIDTTVENLGSALLNKYIHIKHRELI